MRGFGGERVIRSLISYPRSMSAKAVLATISYKIKQDIELEAYQNYVADSLRQITENTFPSASYYSSGEIGSYHKMRYNEMINPQPVKEIKQGEVTKNIRKKLR